ncbi:MAG: FecR domain-containing protein [bacterium]|nr:FecR domain-containing protein [bacterium]
MNDYPDPQLHQAAANDDVARLLRMATPRPTVPAELTIRARAAAEAEWRITVGRRRSRRRVVLAAGGALAATVLLTFALSTRRIPDRLPALSGPLAMLEVVRGGAVSSSATADDGLPRALNVGDAIGSGTLLATGDGTRAAFRLAAGQSLRLDRRTRVQLVSSSVVLLESGTVYVDSDSTSGPRLPLEVHTPLGVARDVGTQFEVRLEDDAMRVRVREGMVQVERGGGTWEAGAGAELTIVAGGLLERRSVPLYGPAWRWNLEIAPSFELEGSSLAAFLDWVTRENGWKLRFTDPALATYAASVTLHGSLEGLTPDQTPELVLPTCGLVYRLEDGIFIAEVPESSEG